MSAELDGGIATLSSRARYAEWAIWAYFAIFAGTSLVELMFLLKADNDISIANAIDMANVGSFSVYLVSAILIGMWIHRAHANLFAAGFTGLEFSPSWSIGWFFVPFASLFKPYQAMRELWTSTFYEADGFAADGASELKIWWGLFLAGNFVSSASARLIGDAGTLSTGLGLDLVSNALLVGSAWMILTIIRKITAAQQSAFGLAETFA